LADEKAVTVAAYVRVSSRSQNNATQTEAISRAATARGDAIGAWFEEKRSGEKLDRPVLTRIRDFARRGEISKLYVFRLDRLTRSGIRDTLAVIEELRTHGCTIVSVSDGFGLDGPAGEVVIAVIAWAAQMERLALGERIAAARARVEAKGGAWGRPRRTTTKQANEIGDRKKKGQTIRQIAIAMKIPRSTVGAIASQKPTPKGSAPRALKSRAKRVASG
jgi:DNA invertase Pin-like site-specific DNA recombinase